MNFEWKVVVARLISVVVCCVGGGATQYRLWHQSGEPWYEALFHWSFLWFIYILLSSLVGEHVLRMLSRTNDDEHCDLDETENRKKRKE